MTNGEIIGLVWLCIFAVVPNVYFIVQMRRENKAWHDRFAIASPEEREKMLRIQRAYEDFMNHVC